MRSYAGVCWPNWFPEIAVVCNVSMLVCKLGG